MKAPKKLLSGCLVGCLLIGCLAGCADTQGTTSQAGSDENVIKVGYVAPFTGVNSDCVTSTEWGNNLYLNQINNVNGGIEVDGEKRKVEIIYRDSQSDVTVATEVATQLVLEDKVDLLVGAWTPNTTVPVAAVAERYQVPCICPNSPVQAWKAGLEEGTDYEWSVGILFDLVDYIGEVVNLWDTLDFNNKVGLMLDNGADGAAAAAVIGDIAASAGYELVDPGRYPIDTNDYTAMINLFIQEDVAVIYGSMTTANYATFLKQCAQLDYYPMLATGGLACHYDYTVETIDSICGYEGAGEYVACESFWCPEYGFGDKFLGLSVEELVNQWVEDNGTQAPEDMGFTLSCAYLIQEVFQQAGTVDKETVRDTLRQCTINSLFGEQTCEGNVFYGPLSVVQWVKGDTWKYEPNIISASTLPEIEVSEFVPYGTGKQ